MFQLRITALVAGLLIAFQASPVAARPPSNNTELTEILARAREELMALDALIESAHNQAVRDEIHRKARMIDELLWEAQQGSAHLGGVSVRSGRYLGGQGGSVHVGGTGVNVSVTETHGGHYQQGGSVHVQSGRRSGGAVHHGGPVACSPGDFQAVVAAVNSESFSDEKLAVLRSAAGGRWFDVRQVKQLLGLFTFGSDQVEAGAILYPRTIDQQNWFQVYDVFTFDSDKDALRQRVGR